ncbi:hypothetical protein [Paraburkholderia xenovorans]
MIRFFLCLLGLLFIQAGVMGHMSSTSADVFTSFGDGLREAVTFDTNLINRVKSLVASSVAG